MPGQFTRGGTKILKNQDGNILILAVFMILFICVLFAGLVEFGRVMIVREQLQTATDAAALAAAGSGTHRWVEINVITDRGVERICESDGEGRTTCRCSDCGETRINGIPGNEVNLLDKGGWRSYCVPTCSGCASGDCWYELVDRNLTYDTHSMEWGVSSEKINDVEKELTVATKQILPYYSYDNRWAISRMIDGLSLKSIDSLINDRSRWMSNWMWLRDYSYYSGCPSSWTDSLTDCEVWYYAGERAYHDIKNKSTVKDIIKALDDMRQFNIKKPPGINSQYAGVAGDFFNVNLPQNAEDANIQKITVYSYDQGKHTQSPYYPSVVVYATAQIKSLFPQWFKKDYKPGDDFFITTNVCAQGISSYRDVADQIAGEGKLKGPLMKKSKWSKVPAEACWQDL